MSAALKQRDSVPASGATLTSVFQELEQLLADSSVEMFDCYGLGAERSGSSPPNADMESCVVATIGFAVADGSRGNILLVASRDLVGALQPPELDMHTDAAICDILGEFANMLLGRLKNALLPRGVTLLLGTPTTAMALKLWVSAPFCPSTWLTFDVGGSPVHVRLDATLTERFELLEPQPSEAPGLCEGEMILF
jgi:hypothetical protein